MKMSPNLAYEIKAEAFRTMTGYMAPGKDASIFAYPGPIEERSDAWDKWRKENDACIRAMLVAVERILPDEG